MLSQLVKKLKAIEPGRVKRQLKPLGNIITLLSLLYLLSVLPKVEFSKMGLSVSAWIILIIIFPIVYVILVFLMSLAWKKILDLSSATTISKISIFRIYAHTSIYKYLPGNILHYVGRQFYTEKLLKKPGEIAKSSIVETAMIFLSIFSLFSISYYGVYCHGSLEKFNLKPGFVYIGILIFPALWVFNKYIVRDIRSLLSNLFIYCFILIVNGVILYLVLLIIAGGEFFFINLFFVSVIYILSWFVGYIIPGSPGGIGVRESIIVYFMEGIDIPQSDALVVALIFRFVTIMGDLLAFAISEFILDSLDKVFEN